MCEVLEMGRGTDGTQVRKHGLAEGSHKPAEGLFSPECGPQKGEDVRQRFFSPLRVLPGRIPPLIVPPSFLWVPASIPTAPQS